MKAQHGTIGMYTNHTCRCDDCREAWRTYCARRKEERVSEGVPDHLHGTCNAYGNYGCRCRACTDAWTQETYARNQRRSDRKAAA